MSLLVDRANESALEDRLREQVRRSFWLIGEDVRTMKPLLPQVVRSAALNLMKGKACEPFEQPTEIAGVVGTDRVITVCFEPASYVTEEFRHGVLHGLLRGDALVIVIVLANDRTGTVPLPDDIGGRFLRLPIVFGRLELEANQLKMRHVDCETGERWEP